MNRLITTASAAAKLGLSKGTVVRYCTDLQIPINKLGNSYVFEEASLEKLRAHKPHRGRKTLPIQLQVRNMERSQNKVKQSKLLLNNIVDQLVRVEKLLNAKEAELVKELAAAKQQ